MERYLRTLPEWQARQHQRQILSSSYWQNLELHRQQVRLADGDWGLPDEKPAQASDARLAPIPAAPVKRRGRPRGQSMNSSELQEMRRQAGCTQEELAEKCRLSVETIQRAESGRQLSADTRAKIAKALRKFTPAH